MNVMLLAASMWGMSIPEPPPPDPLHGVLSHMPIDRAVAYERWNKVCKMKADIEKNRWRYLPTEYDQYEKEVVRQYRIYDALTDYFSSMSVEFRANAVTRLEMMMGADFFLGNLPPLPPELP